MPSLIVDVGDGRPFEYLLNGNQRLAIGSHPDCAVRVSAPGVAPFHCAIEPIGGKWAVRHIRGKLPTRLNGRPVKKAFLQPGDAIGIGPARILVRAARGDPTESGPYRFPRPKASPAARRVRTEVRRSVSSGLPTGVCLAFGGLVVALVAVISLRGGPRRTESEGSRELDLGSHELVADAQLPADLHGPEVRPAEAPRPSRFEVAVPEPLASLEPREIRGTPAEEPRPPQLETAGAASSNVAKLREPKTGGKAIAATEWVDAVYLELSALELEGAEKALEDARRRGARPTLVSQVAAEIQNVRAALEGLLRGVEKAAGAKTVFRSSVDARLIRTDGDLELLAALGNSTPFLIRGGDKRCAELAKERGEAIGSFRFLSLPDEVLLALLELGGLALSEGRSSLALLLLHAEGPSRAAALLGTGGWPEKTRPAYSPGVEMAPWLERKARLLARECDRLERMGSAKPGEWGFVAAEALSAWLTGKHAGAAPEILRPLAERFATARAAALPAWASFHATKAEVAPEGGTRLLYKFDAQKSALLGASDFLAVGASSKAPRYANGALVICGEYRLATGNPFRDKISVRLTARPLDPAGPNVNIALWTQESDAISPVEGEELGWMELLRQEAGSPSDYFVFGAGYRAVTTTMLERRLEQVVLAKTGESVDLPALVVLAGARGSRLHRDRGECLFAESIRPGATGRVQVRIDWTPGGVLWTVGGRRIALDAPEAKSRFQAPGVRSGSVTLLTNGRQVGILELEIVARIDEAWAREENRKLAAAELERAGGNRP